MNTKRNWILGLSLCACALSLPACGTSDNDGSPDSGTLKEGGSHESGVHESGVIDGRAEGSTSSDASGDAADGTAASEAGQTDGAALTACAANFTIENVAFYGSIDAGDAGSSGCPYVTPPIPAITGTSNSVSGSGAISFGTSPYIWTTYTFASTGVAVPTVSLTPSTGALTISANVPVSTDSNYINAAVGLFFPSVDCVNASAYTGISFTVTGDLGGCDIAFQIDDVEDTTPGQSSGTGHCDASNCSNPYSFITKTGTFMVPFTALAGGTPGITVDPTAIESIQWLVHLGPGF
jgi:hypothetical protein